LENFKGYSFLSKKIEQNTLETYALWFDVYSGEVFIFSFEQKTFVKIDEYNQESLVKELRH
jgi:carbonic anhydrase